MNNQLYQLKIYLNYLKSSLGIKFVNSQVELSNKNNTEVERKKSEIYWRNEARENKFFKDVKQEIFKKKILFINQVNETMENASIFDPKYFEVFNNMLIFLDLKFDQISIWETNELDLNQVYSEALQVLTPMKIILFLEKPLDGENHYSVAQHSFLETYSPLNFAQNMDLKRRVWNDFKLIKGTLKSI